MPTTQPMCAWNASDVVLVLTCIAGVLIPSVIALVTAIKAKATTQVQGQAITQQHAKINELAEKNPADVAPLPPMPCDKRDDV